jgi:hypothetical protein
LRRDRHLDEIGPAAEEALSDATLMKRAPDLWSPGALAWTLRAGAALCFVGHGAFGVITKEAWVPYFGVVGIGRDSAYQLMPLIGSLDIVVGLAVLMRPRAALLAWMFGWAVWTALLRPLSGEPAWEALERAGNYGVPLALLLMTSARTSWRDWFAPSTMAPVTPALLLRLQRVLTATLAALMAGHGVLGVMGKHGLTTNYAALFPVTASAITPALGWVEVASALLIVLVPSWPLAVFLAAWKLLTESLFLAAGAPLWEFVERAGSYAAPLALAIVLVRRAGKSSSAAPASGPTALAT